MIRVVFYDKMRAMARALAKIVVIVGPTTSGKSEYAVRLAIKINGEIISADSRQVYSGLDVGTAKITKREMRGIRHHCLDIADTKQTFTVDDFVKAASHAIDHILKKGKTPIIVGGTGFYIDALLYKNAFPNVPPNPTLRASLGSRTTKSLFEMLKKLDPRRAHEIDSKNSRRLIRAIEIATALGKVPKLKKTPRYDTKVIFLNPKPARLKKRIAARTAQMIRRGLVAEIKKLLASKIPRARIRELGFEYKFPLDYIDGKISRPELAQKLNTETWRYAKRQLTWFKKYNP
ncbi:MAG: tRNA dimethylallyltransferase [Parcubacteria group bacterium GW2011_GWA2_47_10b]|nr:MAG: tRNA dimethylallyltransferase [Parcubacteria group bacterium GW2011_GWA2_47_10b]